MMRKCNLFVSLVNNEMKLTNLLITLTPGRRCLSNNQLVDGENDSVVDDKIPQAPNPDTCCRSGCSNCVYLEYATQLEVHFKDGGIKAQQEIDQLIDDPNIKQFIKMQLANNKHNNPEDPPSSTSSTT